MFYYTCYDPESGEVVEVYQFNDPFTYEANASNATEPFVRFYLNGDTHYVDLVSKEGLERPEMSTSLNGLVLSDVPPNSEIIIENETYPCPDGGDVTLNFQHPGMYIVKVSCFPYLDKEFEIDYQP